jgi:hypothetical protein
MISRSIFNVQLQERLGRQHFFYNAFKALSFNRIDGDYAEFGCWGGMTFALAYQEARRHRHKARLWAFDSFQGLPSPENAKDSHPAWVAGAMATPLEQFHSLCRANGIPKDAYSVVPGFYAETLPAISSATLPNIALAYIDCDLYSSTKAVLDFLMPRLKHGMIVAFDDYFCWSANQVSGERRAMLECFAMNSKWELIPYMPFGWHGHSFLVSSKELSRRDDPPAAYDARVVDVRSDSVVA